MVVPLPASLEGVATCDRHTRKVDTGMTRIGTSRRFDSDLFRRCHKEWSEAAINQSIQSINHTSAALQEIALGRTEGFSFMLRRCLSVLIVCEVCAVGADVGGTEHSVRVPSPITS